jgi:hypothetical protein
MVNRKGSGGRTRRNKRGGRSLSERFRRFVRGTPDMYTPPSGTRGRPKRTKRGKDKRRTRTRMNGGFPGEAMVKRSRGIKIGDTITAIPGIRDPICIFNVGGGPGTNPPTKYGPPSPLNNGGRHIVIGVKKEGKYGSREKWLYLEGELKILEKNAKKFEKNPIVPAVSISGASIISGQQIAQMH